MKLSTREDGALVVEHADVVLAVFGVVFALAAVALYRTRPRPMSMKEEIGVALCAAMSVLLAGIERSRFVFDAAAARVAWTRARLLHRSSGELAFAAIREVAVEHVQGTRGRRYCRIVLRTADDAVPVPRTHAVTVEATEAAAERIRGVISASSGAAAGT